MKRYLLLLIPLLALSCGPIRSTVGIIEAEQTLKAAREAGAEEHAAYPMALAGELLRKANPALFGQLEFGHASADGSLRFLPSDAESLGTIAYLHAGVTAASTLNRGGVLCIDELDTSLHPLLARTLIQWFQSPERNPKGAQLLFTTHDTNLLARGVLRRDQVWFTEKDRGGATQLYPLTRIKTRKGDNLQRGYLEGRFGAIPFITGPDDEVA